MEIASAVKHLKAFVNKPDRRRTNIVNMRMPFAIVTQCYSKMLMVQGC